MPSPAQSSAKAFVGTNPRNDRHDSDLRLLVWRKQLPDRRDGKTGFFNQCHQFDAKLAHFIRRLGTVPAGADLCEFSGKQRTESSDQNETRDDPDDVCARRNYFEPSCVKYIECPPQGINKQPEIGCRSGQGIGITAVFN